MEWIKCIEKAVYSDLDNVFVELCAGKIIATTPHNKFQIFILKQKPNEEEDLSV